MIVLQEEVKSVCTRRRVEGLARRRNNGVFSSGMRTEFRALENMALVRLRVRVAQ